MELINVDMSWDTDHRVLDYLPTVASKMPKKNRAVMSPLKSLAAAVLATMTPQSNTCTNTRFQNVNACLHVGTRIRRDVRYLAKGSLTKRYEETGCQTN